MLRKASRISRVVALSAVLHSVPRRTETAHPARCSPLFVLTAERKPRFPSSRVATSLYIAVSASRIIVSRGINPANYGFRETGSHFYLPISGQTVQDCQMP